MSDGSAHRGNTHCIVAGEEAGAGGGGGWAGPGGERGYPTKTTFKQNSVKGLRAHCTFAFVMWSLALFFIFYFYS